MNGVTRGARLWINHSAEPAAVIVLDRGPDGWWVSLEGVLDDNQRPVTKQVSARELYPTKGEAT